MLAAGIIAALLLGAWGMVELGHVARAYPGEFWTAATALASFAVAAAWARFRAVSRDRVPLRPVPPQPPAVPAVPVRPALAPAPSWEGRACDGPGCGKGLDGDPWTATVEGDEREYAFCSPQCGRAWDAARS